MFFEVIYKDVEENKDYEKIIDKVLSNALRKKICWILNYILQSH